jgi:hypothetical protein
MDRLSLLTPAGSIITVIELYTRDSCRHRDAVVDHAVNEGIPD